MEGQVAAPVLAVQNTNTAGIARVKSPHLMCGNALWGVAGAAVSAYFAYLSYSHITSEDYSLAHTWWTVLTYAVWIVLIAGLLTETHCGRERIFFGIVLITFLLGFGFSAWSDAPETAVRHFRIAATALWALAAVFSLTTLSAAKARA